MPVSGPCNKRRCLVDVGKRKVLLISNSEQAECEPASTDVLVLTGSGKVKECSDHLMFSAITQKGGVAIWSNGNAPKIKFAKICGSRPWQPECPR